MRAGPLETGPYSAPPESAGDSRATVVRVLVVEDSKTQAIELQYLLTSQGFDVELVSGADAALAALGQGRYDIVVSDVVMPGMSGFDLCRRLRADPTFAHIAVLLLTALRDPLDIIQALEAGADNFMSKPYEIGRLTARINEVVARRARRRLVEEAPGPPVDIDYLGETFSIDRDRASILDFMAFTFDDFVFAKKREHESKLAEAQRQLELEKERLHTARLQAGAAADSSPTMRGAAMSGWSSPVTKETAPAFRAAERLAGTYADAARPDLLEPQRTLEELAALVSRRWATRLGGGDTEYLRAVAARARAAQVLSTEVLDLATVPTGPRSAATVDLEEVVGAAIGQLADEIEKYGARVNVDSLPEVNADERDLRILFAELIRNALRFRSNTAPRIDISAERDHATGTHVVAVRDNGIGFPGELAELALEPFERLHGGSAYPGAGLGLTRCRRIIEAAGGSIAVQSTPADGTTVRITFAQAVPRHEIGS